MERYRPLPEMAAAPAVAPDSVLAPQDEKIAAALALLEAGIDRIMTTDGFRYYLEAQATFHTYSFNNTLLIMAQRPDATRVAGYLTWKKLERHVKAGEKAMKIFVPHLRTEVDTATGEKVEQLVGFGLGNVFDIAQTDGKPLPEGPRPSELANSSEVARELYGTVADWLATKGIAVMRAPLYGEVKGAYYPERHLVKVRPGMSADQSVKTLLHEAAHVAAEHKPWYPKEDIETVAEASSFVVCQRYGIDTSDYTFPYVARWAEDRDVVKRNLNAVQKTSTMIIQGLEKGHRQ